MRFFKYFLSRLIMNGDCGTFDFSLEEAVESDEKTLKIKVGASLHSNPIPAAVSELSACHEKIRITENTVLLTLPHPAEAVHEARSSGAMTLLPVSRRQIFNSSTEDVMR